MDHSVVISHGTQTLGPPAEGDPRPQHESAQTFPFRKLPSSAGTSMFLAEACTLCLYRGHDSSTCPLRAKPSSSSSSSSSEGEAGDDPLENQILGSDVEIMRFGSRDTGASS